MRQDALARFRCPACAAPGAEAGFHLDATRVGGGLDGGAAGDVLEGYLVCRRCRAAFPIVGGVAVLPRDLEAHLAAQGNVYRRTRIGDPRLARWLLGRAGTGEDHVPFDEVVARYLDLLPAAAPSPAPARPMPPVDDALDRALRAARARGPGLDVGCGVGRGTFVLAGRVGEALGVDRSVARIRRARNVQSAAEFSLPPAPGQGDVPIDLARLARAGADFAVADPEALPLEAGSYATVVLRLRDGEGAFADPAAARREAERVLAPGGLLLVERATRDGSPAAAPVFDPVPAGGTAPAPRAVAP